MILNCFRLVFGILFQDLWMKIHEPKYERTQCVRANDVLGLNEYWLRVATPLQGRIYIVKFWTHAPSPIFFIFMQFSVKFGQIIDWRPPPPLWSCTLLFLSRTKTPAKLVHLKSMNSVCIKQLSIRYAEYILIQCKLFVRKMNRPMVLCP